MTIRPFACLAAAMAFLVAASVVFAPPALATKEYAKAEAKECGYCHVSEKGSGPRNPKGREYEANGHRFGVRSWSSEANERKFLRASSALVAQWYGEAARLLDELAKEERLPGGVALVEATRDRFKMFQGPWIRSARKLLEKGERGVPNALVFLVKLESQFPATDEGREAAKLLDGLAKGESTREATAEARAAEKARLLLLEGRTEFQMGDAAAARALYEKALADPASKAFEKEIREAMDELAPAR